MKRHTWVKYEVDGGSVGIGEFWGCVVCGAGGGSTFFYKKPKHPFFPNGSGLELTMDCKKSKALIAKAIRTGLRKDLKWDVVAEINAINKGRSDNE